MLRNLAAGPFSFLDRHDKAVRTVLLVLLCMGFGVYSASLGTDTNWDLKNYHLYSGFAFFEHRLFYDIAPAQLQTYLPPLFNIAYYALFAGLNDSPSLFAFIMGLQAGVYVYFVFRVSFIVASATSGPGLFPWLAAAVSAALGATGAGFDAIIGTSFSDVAISALCLAALTLVLDCLHRGIKGNRRLIVAGLLTGLAMAIKLTAIMYCATLALVVLLMFSFRRALVFGLTAGLSFLALWGPHAWQLWAATGNPFFPVYNNIFKSPDWFTYGINGWRYAPQSAFELIFFPFYWTVRQVSVSEIYLQETRPAILYGVLALWLVVAITRFFGARPQTTSSGPFAIMRAAFEHPVPTALVIYIICAYLLWLDLFAIYRYFVGLEALVGAGLIVAVASIVWHSKAAILGVLAAAFVIGNTFVERPEWGHVHSRHLLEVGPLPVAAGSLVLIADNAPHAYLVLSLPRDARVLGINNNFIAPGQSFGLNRRIEELVKNHHGPFATISAPSTTDQALQGVLAYYGLVAQDCIVVPSNLEREGHKVCNAMRRE